MDILECIVQNERLFISSDTCVWRTLLANGRRAKISALGTYVPPRVLTNKDLETMVETTDQWILERTGIRERHLVDKGVAASDLAVEAVKKLVESHPFDLQEVDLIVVGTVTPDMMYPSTACLVQHKLGIARTWGFDVSAGCSGFVYALNTGTKFIESGQYKKVLVIGSDVNSSMTDFTDRAVCIIFGDGAGAVLLEPAEEGEAGIIDHVAQIEGVGGQYLYMPGGGSLNPASHETVDQENALYSSGWTASLQVCGEENGGDDGARSGEERADRRGRRLLHRAPGQQAHHHGHRRPAEDADGESHHQHRPLRQYHGGNDSAGHANGD